MAAAADSPPDSDTDLDPAPDSTPTPDSPHDCPTCSRRVFLKGVGATATAAGALSASGGLTAVASGQQSSGVEVIEGSYEVEVTDLPNNTLENKIIRANGAVVHITARGSDFTIRNVGIQGPVAKGGNAAVIEPIVTSSSGAGIISNCYIDDVGDNCVFVNASHSGRLDITSTYFGKSVEDSTYASPPGNGSEFTQRGKDAGEGGTVHIDECYSQGAVDYAFRLGSPGSSVTNSTVVNAGTALADLYGNSVLFENVDVSGSGIGLKIGDHDEGNMRLLAASGRTIVAAVVSNVRIDASDQVDRNDVAGVDAVLKGQIAGNPDPRIPTGVPTSAEAAGRGQSSAGPASNRRRPSSSAPIQPSGGTVTHPRDRAGPRIVVRSWGDLEQAADSAPAGARIYIPPGTVIRANGRSVTFDQDNISIYSDGTRFGRGKVATIRQANGKPGGWQYAVIRFTGANGAVAGLRLEGPTPSGFFEPGSPYPLASGVLFEGSGAAGGQVFNCEVVGWHHAGIWAMDTQDLHVFLCNIHDNAMNNLGYGLKVQSSQNVVAEYSLWDGNRHSITSDRDRDSSYTFQFNNVGGRRPNHAIDVHGESRSQRGYGGRRIVIRRNTIAAPEDDGDDAITLRGYKGPVEGALIKANHLLFEDKSRAVTQKIEARPPEEFANAETGGFNNVRLVANAYGAGAPPQGVGAPEQMPSPGEVSRLGPTGRPAPGPSPREFGQIIGTLFTSALLATGIAIVLLILVPLLLLLGAILSAGTD